MLSLHEYYNNFDGSNNDMLQLLVVNLITAFITILIASIILVFTHNTKKKSQGIQTSESHYLKRTNHYGNFSMLPNRSLSE